MIVIGILVLSYRLSYKLQERQTYLLLSVESIPQSTRQQIRKFDRKFISILITSGVLNIDGEFKSSLCEIVREIALLIEGNIFKAVIKILRTNQKRSEKELMAVSNRWQQTPSSFCVHCINLSQESNLTQSIVQKNPLSGVCRVYVLESSTDHFVDKVLCLCLTVIRMPAYR